MSRPSWRDKPPQPARRRWSPDRLLSSDCPPYLDPKVKPAGLSLVYASVWRSASMFKKVLMVGVILTGLISPAVAQRQRFAGQSERQQLRQLRQKRLKGTQLQRQRRPNAGIRKFQKALNLSDAQSGKLRSFLNERQQEVQRLRS